MKNLIYYLVDPLLQFINITIMKTLILILLFGLVASYPINHQLPINIIMHKSWHPIHHVTYDPFGCIFIPILDMYRCVDHNYDVLYAPILHITLPPINFDM